MNLFAQDCDQPPMRTAFLPTHLQASHPSLLGFDISDAGQRDLLKMGSAPFRPIAKSPPPLPDGILYSHNINPPTVSRGRSRPQKARSPSSDGRRWIRLDTAIPVSTLSEANDASSIDLPDLPRLGILESNLYDINPNNITIRKKRFEPPNNKFAMSNSHRLVVSLAGDDEVPVSILYDTFAAKVDGLKRNGLL